MAFRNINVILIENNFFLYVSECLSQNVVMGLTLFSKRRRKTHDLIFNFVAVLTNRQRAFFISTVTRTLVKTFGQSKG